MLSLSAFGVREDALYQEIARASERIRDRHIPLCEASGAGAAAGAGGAPRHNSRTFLELLESELARVGDYVSSQQRTIEYSAKALLTNLEAAAAASTAPGTTPTTSTPPQLGTYREQTEQLMDTAVRLQRFTRENRRILRDIAAHADAKLVGSGTTAFNNVNTTHNTATGLLQRTFQGCPWNDDAAHSSLVVVFSDIYQLLRDAESNAATGGSEAWVAPSSFERTTTKYWVEQDRLLDLMLAAVREAPLLVYGRTGRLTSKEECLVSSSSSSSSSRCCSNSDGRDRLWDVLATPITSVYLDSRDMALYRERLPRREGARLLRIRWYGRRRPRSNETVFVEMKTHHEKWINEKSVKERVSIRARDVPRFLDCDAAWTATHAEAMILAATPSMDASALSQSADRLLRMHRLVVQHRLRPCVRSVYVRAAFQSSRSNALRFTIDRNVTLIDETRRRRDPSHNSSSSRAGTEDDWCLPDDAAVAQSCIKRVPYVVLEVKIAKDGEIPSVVSDLERRGVVQDATKFSKFLTGAAAFHADQLDMLPHWADHPAFVPLFTNQAEQRSTPPTPATTTTAPHRVNWPATTMVGENTDHDRSGATSRATSPSNCVSDAAAAGAAIGTAANNNDLDLVDTDHAMDKQQQQQQQQQQHQPQRSPDIGRVVALEGTSEEFTVRRPVKRQPRNSFSSFSSSASGFFVKRRSNRRVRSSWNAQDTSGAFPNGKNRDRSPSVASKRPARVEPKSYFANERTFIQWISAALMLVTISVLLLNLQGEMVTTTTSSGGVTTVWAAPAYAQNLGICVCTVSVVLVCYATFVYFRRLFLLRTGSPYGYVDKFGPLLLAVAVCAGVVILLVHVITQVQYFGTGTPAQVTVRAEPGSCYQHSTAGISKLEYQPSDVVVDTARNRLMVASLQRIVAHSLAPPSSSNATAFTGSVRALVIIPNSNLEGIAIVGDRVFALSEGPDQTELIELTWTSGGGDALSVSRRWRLAQQPQMSEGIAHVPDAGGDGPGRLFVEVNGMVNVYDVPGPPSSALPPAFVDDVPPARVGTLNIGMLTSGLADVKIGSMSYFEGVMYIVHDNEMIVRAWDLETGDLLAEIPLPQVEGGHSREWEGIAFERRQGASRPGEELVPSSLRGTAAAAAQSNRDEGESAVIVHLALDTPAEVWSFAVKEGATRGNWIFPPCAAAYQVQNTAVAEATTTR